MGAARDLTSAIEGAAANVILNPDATVDEDLTILGAGPIAQLARLAQTRARSGDPLPTNVEQAVAAIPAGELERVGIADRAWAIHRLKSSVNGRGPLEALALVHELAEERDEVRMHEIDEQTPSGVSVGGVSSSNSYFVQRDWPAPLGEAAYHGPAGEFVRLVEPHSEADPAALLVHLLVYYGNAIGAEPRFMVEANPHRANLYAVIVGTTSGGRKGTSAGWPRRLIEEADPEWSDRHVDGVGSGEVIVHEVRDERRNGEGEVVDAGVADKRLMIDEGELAGVLRSAGRRGATISPMLRKAWEKTTLRNVVKSDPARATGAHVSMIGHITPEELRRELADVEVANGFANRILWIAARRSKYLPRGGTLTTDDLIPMVKKFATLIDFAKNVSFVEHAGGYWSLWDEVYPDLTAERPGLMGSLLARGAPIVRRLALIYGLLDGYGIVSRVHLEAALEVWRYSVDSAAHVFGDATGDPEADAILSALRRNADGLTRTDLHTLFARNKKGAEIERALGVLLAAGLARPLTPDPGERAPGRPAERWAAA